MSNSKPNFVLGRVSQVLGLLLKEALKPGDFVVDATLGNGNDAELLLDIVGKSGFLMGFDIQPEAIAISQARLSRFHDSQYLLIQDSHHLMQSYFQNRIPKAVIFNLGYLPKADKTKTTQWPTTQLAIEAALDSVASGGFVAVTTYPGHEAGAIEDTELQGWLKGLNQKMFEASCFQMMNQINQPPKLYWISRR